MSSVKIANYVYTNRQIKIHMFKISMYNSNIDHILIFQIKIKIQISTILPHGIIGLNFVGRGRNITQLMMVHILF